MPMVAYATTNVGAYVDTDEASRSTAAVTDAGRFNGDDTWTCGICPNCTIKVRSRTRHLRTRGHVRRAGAGAGAGGTGPGGRTAPAPMDPMRALVVSPQTTRDALLHLCPDLPRAYLCLKHAVRRDPDLLFTVAEDLGARALEVLIGYVACVQRNPRAVAPCGAGQTGVYDVLGTPDMVSWAGYTGTVRYLADAPSEPDDRRRFWEDRVGRPGSPGNLVLQHLATVHLDEQLRRRRENRRVERAILSRNARFVYIGNDARWRNGRPAHMLVERRRHPVVLLADGPVGGGAVPLYTLECPCKVRSPVGWVHRVAWSDACASDPRASRDPETGLVAVAGVPVAVAEIRSRACSGQLRPGAYGALTWDSDEQRYVPDYTGTLFFDLPPSDPRVARALRVFQRDRRNWDAARSSSSSGGGGST